MRRAWLALTFALLSAGCDRWIRRAEQTAAPSGLPDALTARPAPSATPKPSVEAAGLQETLDLDGDGAAETARIARVGEYSVTDAIGFVGEGGSGRGSRVDPNQDAVIVRFSSGREQAINFPFVEAIAKVAESNDAAATARALGCDPPEQGQALLARGEEGAMLIGYAKGSLFARPCSS